MLWRRGKLVGAMDDAALVSAACLGTFKWYKVAPHKSDVIHLSSINEQTILLPFQQSLFCHMELWGVLASYEVTMSEAI